MIKKVRELTKNGIQINYHVYHEKYQYSYHENDNLPVTVVKFIMESKNVETKYLTNFDGTFTRLCIYQ